MAGWFIPAMNFILSINAIIDNMKDINMAQISNKLLHFKSKFNCPCSLVSDGEIKAESSEDSEV